MNAKMKYFEQYDEATNIEYNLKLLDESADDDDDDEYDFFKHRKTGEFRHSLELLQ